MDLMMRLERVLTRDYPVLVAAVAAGENALDAMEKAQEERFTAAIGSGFKQPRAGQAVEEEERAPRHFNLKAARRDWDAFKFAADAHVARELAEYLPLARRIAAGEHGISHIMIDLTRELDDEHQTLRSLGVRLVPHGLTIEPIRDAYNGANAAINEHVRMHDVELNPQLTQGTQPGTDRRELEDRYRHSSSIRASARPAPVRAEEPKAGLLSRWFSLIKKQR